MQSQQLLAHFYGPASAAPATRAGGAIIGFDQSEFINRPRSSLDQVA